MRRSGRSRPSSMPHRPAEPGIDARRRRPYALDQSAERSRGRLASAAPPAGRRCAVARRAARRRRTTRSANAVWNTSAIVAASVTADRSVPAPRAGRRRPRRAPSPSGPSKAMATPFSSRDSAISDLAVALRRIRRNHAALSSTGFERRQRRLQRRDQRFGAVELARRPGARAARLVQRRDFAAAQLVKLVAKARKSRASPAVPACGRVPRNSASSSAAIAVLQRALRAAEPAQRMFQQRKQRRRLQSPARLPPQGGQTCRPASPSAHRRRNRRSRDSSGRAPPSRAGPARGPASPAPPICSRCRASRMPPRSQAPPSPDWAPRSPRDCSMPAAIFSAISGRASRHAIAPSRSTDAWPPTASISRPPAAGGRGISTSPRVIPKRCSSACIANCGWLEAGGAAPCPGVPLRHRSSAMLRRRDRCRAPAAPPRRAAAGHRVQEFCRCRHRAGRAGGDDGPAMMLSTAARLRLRSGGRAAPQARSGRSRPDDQARAFARCCRKSSEYCQY